MTLDQWIRDGANQDPQTSLLMHQNAQLKHALGWLLCQYRGDQQDPSYQDAVVVYANATD